MKLFQKAKLIRIENQKKRRKKEQIEKAKYESVLNTTFEEIIQILVDKRTNLKFIFRFYSFSKMKIALILTG